VSSREALAELLAAGMTKAEVARAVGRDSSVMSQIERGAKPYANLEPTLRALAEQRAGRAVTIPEAPRRTTAAGDVAKVRGKTKFAGGRVVRVKQQAVKSGARSILARLRQAAAAGLKVAFTVVYPTGVELGKSGHRSPPEAEAEHTIELGFGGAHQGGGHAQDMVDRAEAEGGDVGAALSAYIAQNDLGDTDGVTPLGIELRTWQ
jgi:transcriptional regulator with XRE-family HTH domain